MAKENPDNIQFVCDAHASKPQEKYAKRTPESFVGKYVKKGFPVKHPGTKEASLEHMWVSVKKVNKDGELVGVLDNDPIMETTLKHKDTVTVKLTEIEDVLS